MNQPDDTTKAEQDRYIAPAIESREPLTALAELRKSVGCAAC